MIVTGTAAGVPFTALPPVGGGPAPLVVTWHMMDAPCTDAAFAAALPLAGVDAWRVHLGMPWCGARAYPEGYELSSRDPMMLYVDPVVRQAVDEFPAALVDLRARFPITDAPIGLVGASLGGAVALTVTASGVVPVAALAVVNAAIRASSVVALISGVTDTPYPWDDASRAAADRLDFIARAADLDGTALLVVSGDEDFPMFRIDAAALADTVPGASLITVPGLAHPLAERPGEEPAPQTPEAKLVDDAITAWFITHLAA
ncbi:alpha/beta fold hydrolase [Planosporangium mesophilum]|uniref:Peptidase n=1 Tax=Planosporangium mesophilum TaxID=689768 RepID=A0A8J3X3U5_9ACTN|nr:alpha/beta hydrolase [Planosporangium mesophilum]NJC86327.1 alpha/beta hydrolase [Planosporangium mesophilum]GII25879.1 peptidase [Planosporangium mesophilum]